MHTVQPPTQLPSIPGLSVEGAQAWLLEHTLGCEVASADWERPQRWRCVNDMREVGEGVLVVRMVGDAGGVYQIAAAVSEIPATEDADDYAASFFWNLMNLLFAGSGAPDYAPVLRAVSVEGQTEFAGLLFDYGREGATRTLLIEPLD